MRPILRLTCAASFIVMVSVSIFSTAAQEPVAGQPETSDTAKPPERLVLPTAETIEFTTD
jgi:hypothetical protein